MPSNKQRRQAAQRHLQRQLERRAELARKRRRNLLIIATVAALALVAGAVALVAVLGGDDDPTVASDSPTSAAGPTTGPGAERAGQTTTAGPCTYTYDDRGSSGMAVDAPSGELPAEGTVAATMATSAGTIGLSLDRAGSGACATASFVSLAAQGFFDGTPCHRLTTSPGLEVLQCGDPSGQGTGGPGYGFPTQVTGTETYPRGVIAMANSGQGTDGSQFFLVYGDSLQGNPNYTVFGTIDEPGLGVLDTIAAAGVADGSTDGAPTTPVTIDTVTVQQ